MSKYWVVISKYSTEDFQSKDAEHISNLIWQTIGMDEAIEAHTHLCTKINEETQTIKVGFIIFCNKSMAVRITARLRQFLYFEKRFDISKSDRGTSWYGIGPSNHAQEVILLDLIIYMRYEAFQEYLNNNVDSSFLNRNFHSVIEKLFSNSDSNDLEDEIRLEKSVDEITPF